MEQVVKESQDVVKKIKLRRVIEGSSDAQLFNRLLRKIKSSIDVILVRIYLWIRPFGYVITLRRLDV